MQGRVEDGIHLMKCLDSRRIALHAKLGVVIVSKYRIMFRLNLKSLAAFAVSTLAVVLFLSPSNVPLYDLIIFAVPDPRTPNIDSDLQALRTQGIKCGEVVFPSKNGMLLHGLFFERADTKRVFLFSHPKGNNIYAQFPKARLLLGCGGSVFLYDYQGFGRSQGRASIQNSCEDALAAYDYLRDHEKRSAKDITAVGQSWGSGVTGHLAQSRDLAGVVMISGFSSLRQAGRETFFWLRCYPDWTFPAAANLDNLSVFSKPHAPLLLVHGKNDSVVSWAEAEQLYAAALDRKSLLLLPVGHSGVGDGVEFAVALRKFLEENQI